MTVSVCAPQSEGGIQWTAPTSVDTVATGALSATGTEGPDASGLETLVFPVPSGWGKNLPLVVNAGGASSPLCNVSYASPIAGTTFSYPAPLVLSTSGPATSGGLLTTGGVLLTVNGIHFGPTTPSASSTIGMSATVTAWDGSQIACTLGQVVTNNRAFQCTIGAGYGGNLPISVVRGTGSDSQAQVGGPYANMVFYGPPEVFSITSASGVCNQGGQGSACTHPANDTITVTGVNFGTSATIGMLRVMVTDNSCSAAACTIYRVVDTIAHQLTMITSQTTIRFNLPTYFGTGRKITILFPASTQPGYSPAATVLATYGQYTPVSDYPPINYRPPYVAAITQAPTAGGVITLTGTGFGTVYTSLPNTPVVGFVGGGGIGCTSVQIISDDTVLTCQMSAGTGVNYPVTLTDNAGPSNQTYSGSLTYSYEAPTVATIDGSTGDIKAKPGDTVTLTGTNFGSDASVISVKMGNTSCTSVSLLASQTQLSCVAGSGKGGRPSDLPRVLFGIPRCKRDPARPFPGCRQRHGHRCDGQRQSLQRRCHSAQVHLLLPGMHQPKGLRL